MNGKVGVDDFLLTHSVEELEALCRDPLPLNGHAGNGSRVSSLSFSLSDNDNDDTLQPLPVTTLAALWERHREGVAWLVEGYIPLGGLTVVSGASESMKSWAMADLARAVTAAGLWLAHFPVPQGEALFIEQERAGNLAMQTRLLATAHGQDFGGLAVLTPHDYAFRLLDPRSRTGLHAYCAAHPALRLIVVNSLRATYRGHPGSGIDTNEALGWLGTLAEAHGVAVIVVDGTNKPGGVGLLRGTAGHADSYQKIHESDAVLYVERDRDPLGRGVGSARVYIGKARAEPAGDPFMFGIVPSYPEGARLEWQGPAALERPTARPPSAAEQVLAAFGPDDVLSPAELATRLGLSVGVVKNALTELGRRGLLEHTGRGQWRTSSSSPSYRENDDDDVLISEEGD